MKLDNRETDRAAQQNGQNEKLDSSQPQGSKTPSESGLKEEIKVNIGLPHSGSDVNEVRAESWSHSGIHINKPLAVAPFAQEGRIRIPGTGPLIPPTFMYRSQPQFAYRGLTPPSIYQQANMQMPAYAMYASRYANPASNFYMPTEYRYPMCMPPMYPPMPQMPPPIRAAVNHQMSSPIPGMMPPGGLLQLEMPRNAPADGSLDSLDDTPKSKSLLSGKAYKSRNVYKSIIRHLFSYIRKNREDIIRILTEAGFSMQDIEHGFFKINYYNDLEREQSNKKNSQATIKKMVTKRSIYTYILRETLNTMLYNWSQGKFGKVSESNSEVYKDVCKYFYDEAVKTSGQSAQGRSFFL